VPFEFLDIFGEQVFPCELIMVVKMVDSHVISLSSFKQDKLAKRNGQFATCVRLPADVPCDDCQESHAPILRR